MKWKVLIFSCVIVAVSGYIIKVPTAPVNQSTTSSEWVFRQKLLLSLFDNVCDESRDPTVIRYAEEFIESLNTGTGNYGNKEVLIALKNYIDTSKLLAKGVIFTEYNEEHFNELRKVVDVFCSAQDFVTFYKAAAWFRQNLNCGLFVDAMYASTLKRRDTENIALPAPYEVLPNYFIKSDVVALASTLLATGKKIAADNISEDGNSFVISANYTSTKLDDVDSKLAYFHEDIGLNTYYYFKKMKELFTDVNAMSDSTHGMYLFFFMKQLANRYDLERYSNGINEVKPISWNEALDINLYDPMLIYSDGIPFNQRTSTFNVLDQEKVSYLTNIETKLDDLATTMIQKGLNINQFYNLVMEILVTGNNNYQTISQMLLDGNKNMERYPSVLEHYMTTLRDPVFWKINKKIVELVDTTLNLLPSYAKSELYFPGVEIINVNIKKVMTHFDDFEIDVTNALKVEDQNDFKVKLTQPRLNHKTFSIKYNVSSLVSQNGLVKVFMGPKIVPGEMNIAKNKFLLMDYFEISLKKGLNVISRTSDVFNKVSNDLPSMNTLLKNIEFYDYGIETTPFMSMETFTNFPVRLSVPKGSEEGLPFSLFIIVAPFTKMATESPGLANVQYNDAIFSPNYPLDRKIENWQLIELPNAIFKEIIIAHKDNAKGGINDGQKGDEEKFDYSSKKAQYGQKTSYEKNGYQKLPTPTRLLQKKTPIYSKAKKIDVSNSITNDDLNINVNNKVTDKDSSFSHTVNISKDTALVPNGEITINKDYAKIFNQEKDISFENDNNFMTKKVNAIKTEENNLGKITGNFKIFDGNMNKVIDINSPDNINIQKGLDNNVGKVINIGNMDGTIRKQVDLTDFFNSGITKTINKPKTENKVDINKNENKEAGLDKTILQSTDMLTEYEQAPFTTERILNIYDYIFGQSKDNNDEEEKVYY